MSCGLWCDSLMLCSPWKINVLLHLFKKKNPLPMKMIMEVLKRFQLSCPSFILYSLSVLRPSSICDIYCSDGWLVPGRDETLLCDVWWFMGDWCWHLTDPCCTAGSRSAASSAQPPAEKTIKGEMLFKNRMTLRPSEEFELKFSINSGANVTYCICDWLISLFIYYYLLFTVHCLQCDPNPSQTSSSFYNLNTMWGA